MAKISFIHIVFYLIFYFQDFRMTLFGSGEMRGSYARLVSPSMSYKGPTWVTFDAEVTLDDIYILSSLHVDLLDSRYHPSGTLLGVKRSTQGVSKLGVCVPRGEWVLSFVGIWGVIGTPRISLDNVNVTGETCNVNISKGVFRAMLLLIDELPPYI